MRLYTNNNGSWLGTQTEAKKEFGKINLVEVPVSKEELLKFLNQHNVGATSSTEVAEKTDAIAVQSGNVPTSPLLDIEWATGEKVIIDLHNQLLKAKFAIDEIMGRIGQKPMPKESTEDAKSTRRVMRLLGDYKYD